MTGIETFLYWRIVGLEASFSVSQYIISQAESCQQGQSSSHKPAMLTSTLALIGTLSQVQPIWAIQPIRTGPFVKNRFR